MLLSMTGYGDARWQGPGLTISVELRSVNNRFLKILTKLPEHYQKLEPEIERALREKLKRGTVQVQILAQREPRPDDYRINIVALDAFRQQLENYAASNKFAFNLDPASLLAIPGVVEDATTSSGDTEEAWAQVGPVVNKALARLEQMRREEGVKMAQELSAQAESISNHLREIALRAPQVASDYRKRLHEKLQNTLSEYNISLDATQLIKEVAIFADRTDIHEENVRLGSHLEQFHAFLREAESTGRKLDFLIQEMNREVNTIGSKANDIAITRHVVEMKGALEKMRELIQNVE
ncbi:MAG: YicC/YloC family endoribonuclease [Gemmatales bacterium]